MMEKYKTWEVVKLLSENKNLKFRNRYHTIGSNQYGFLEIKKSSFKEKKLDGNINLNSLWYLEE